MGRGRQTEDDPVERDPVEQDGVWRGLADPLPDEHGYREFRLAEDGWREVDDAPAGPADGTGEVSSGGSSVSSVAILFICCVLFLLANVVQAVPMSMLVFSPGNGLVFPGIITHMFSHANFMHLLGNMLMLVFLGTVVERTYGTGRYLALFLLSGLFAALAEGAVTPDGLLLGASGALAGIMAAFVRHYPRAMLYLWGVAPIPAWLFITLWLAYNIWGAGGLSSANIAFTAHLGGFVAGLILSLLLVPPHVHISKVIE